MSADILSRVQSQDTAVNVMRRALRSNCVHHAYLFDGPVGVGKELAALGLAQALVCEKRDDGVDAACGTCSACARAEVTEAGTTRHPDVVFIERGLYDPMRIGRRTPETQDISIDQVRTLVLARAAFGPHEGRAKVFIVRRAEELSISAANALLKTLEEPGPRTHFIVMSASANELLPTVRSRTMRVRFGALPEKTVAALLVARGIAENTAKKAASVASGSMHDALIAANEDHAGDAGAWVARIFRSIDKRDRGDGYVIAEEAKKDKNKLPENLLSLASALRSRMRDSAMLAPRAGDASDDVARKYDETALANAYGLVMTARRDLEANNSAQLVMEALYLRLADTLA